MLPLAAPRPQGLARTRGGYMLKKQEGDGLMSDVTTQDDSPDTRENRRQRDRLRLRQVATKHAFIALVLITLWGLVDFWAGITGQLGVHSIAVLNAIVVGFVLASLVHEWGHFAAARLAGAVSPVLKEQPLSLTAFFMFTFKHELNSRQQFLSMSLGGIIGNWLLCLLLFMLLSLHTPAQLALIATCIAIAVNVSVFELPIFFRVKGGTDPEETILNRLKENRGLSSQLGSVLGIALWLVGMLVLS